MTDLEIQNWIESNMIHPDGTPMIDTQTFYEGAKWMRNQDRNRQSFKSDRDILIAFKNWEIDNDIKNLLPEQLADFYLKEYKLQVIRF